MAEVREEFFKPINAEENTTTEVESMCVNCEDNGITKLLLTKIPYYKEVILSSFSCPHCHYTNNEIQSAGETQSQGVELILQAEDPVDLNRQVVKADHAAISIPQLDLEIPSGSQKGEITTVEGILQRVYEGLDQDQKRRIEEHPEDYQKIQGFLEKIQECRTLKTPFTLKIRDISGQSFISPPPTVLPGHKDTRLQQSHFDRTKDEDHAVGYFPELPNELAEGTTTGRQEDGNVDDLADEVLQFSTTCNGCGKDCMTKMKLTKIPHFKEVVIMATDCDHCGERTNEVKSGGGIEKKGRRISLKVTGVDDLCRDVLKAETCSIEIPELELHVGGGTIGGKFTTLEGLLENVKDQLQQDNPLISGDSAEPEMKLKMAQFCQKLNHLISVEVPFTVILDDPAGNSYLQNIYAPDDDPNMEVVDYERTFEQDEDLGLNDINTGDPAEANFNSGYSASPATADETPADNPISKSTASSSADGESSSGGRKKE